MVQIVGRWRRGHIGFTDDRTTSVDASEPASVPMRQEAVRPHAAAMTTTIRARLVALLLVIGPLAFTFGDLLRRIVEPDGSPKASAITAAVNDHTGLWLLAGLLSIVAAFCIVPGVLALIPRDGRGSVLTTIGVAMVTIGGVASAGHAVAFYAPYALYARANTSADALTALDDASESYPLLVALIVLFIAGMMLGTIVLFLGLRRARRVPIWSVLAAVVFVACGSTGGVLPGIIGIVAALAAFGPAAASVGEIGRGRVREPGVGRVAGHPERA